MTVSKEDLQAQLLDYRKASRALMWYYDSSDKLYELITEALEPWELLQIDKFDVNDEIDSDWDRPKGISLDAFTDIKGGHNDWSLRYCSVKDLKMKTNSFLLDIYLLLDYWPKNDVNESLSGLEIGAWRVTNVTGKAIHSYDEIEDSYDKKLIKENSGIQSDGEIIQPMKLTVFPNIWLANKRKYKGDYAAGLYDLADLVDEDAVLNTVIADITKLIKEWSLQS